MMSRITILSLLILVLSLTGVGEASADTKLASIYLTEQEEILTGLATCSKVQLSKNGEWKALTELPMNYNRTRDNKGLVFSPNRSGLGNLGSLGFFCVRAKSAVLQSPDNHDSLTQGSYPLKLPLKIFRELRNRSPYMASLNGL